MIIKIKSHKRDTFQKILEYMMGDRARLLNKDGNLFTITHNLKGKSIPEWVRQFKENELLRARKRKDSIRLTHEILSWHREDSKDLTLEMLKDMTQEYIRLRNPKGIYVAAAHFDKEHVHVHICASGVEFKTGKSLRLSKVDLVLLKREIQNYQKEKYPELSNSNPRHGKKHSDVISEKEYQLKLRTGRQTEKELLLALINQCYNKATSTESLMKSLTEQNIKPYSREGETTGVIFKGKKFRFNRLGFSSVKLNQLEFTERREKNIQRIRHEKRKQHIQKEI